ncbi:MULTISPECIES: hypothetical protein [Terrabacteria group]|uniref:hypothetical protein n=1 Tax=Bacillati TaxID=1783272 RepID=UPI001C6EA88B|nr:MULTISPECIES: hypothetical protein [Terrabacteria group]MBW9212645.1 hypothetical protein [Trueperella sp. zg.1013]
MKVGIYGIESLISRQLLEKKEINWVLLDQKKDKKRIQGIEWRVYDIHHYPVHELDALICLKEEKVSCSIPQFKQKAGMSLVHFVEEMKKRFPDAKNVSLHIYPSLAHYGLQGFRQYQQELSALTTGEEIISSFSDPILNNLVPHSIGCIDWECLWEEKVSVVQVPILRVDSVEFEFNSEVQQPWLESDIVLKERGSSYSLANQDKVGICLKKDCAKNYYHFFAYVDTIYYQVKEIENWLLDVKNK